MNIDDMIKGTFGSNDHRFARHQNDLERAREMIKKAKAAGISELQLKNKLKQYLISKNCQPKHIEEELEEFSNGWHWVA